MDGLRRRARASCFRRLCPYVDRARLAEGRDRSRSTVVDQGREGRSPGTAPLSCGGDQGRPRTCPAAGAIGDKHHRRREAVYGHRPDFPRCAITKDRQDRGTLIFSGWSKSWPALLKVAREYGLTGDLRLHDLRKSARSHWARIGVHDRVSEAMLNHAEANVLIATYDKKDLTAEKIDASEFMVRLDRGRAQRAREGRRRPSV